MKKRVAIYLTDTCHRKENEAFDNYAQKFENLLAPHMPGVVFEHFDVAKDRFPLNPLVFDGIVITGSAAFVTEPAPWIETLFKHIRLLDSAKTKLFAVCFGHQAVSVALGGKVVNRDIVLGSPTLSVIEQKDWMTPWMKHPRIFAGNFQQVAELPDGMICIGSHQDCPIAMATKGNHILSLQFHPELSSDYMHTYIDNVAHKVSDDCVNIAQQEVKKGSDGQVIGQWVAQFMSL